MYKHVEWKLFVHFFQYNKDAIRVWVGEFVPLFTQQKDYFAPLFTQKSSLVYPEKDYFAPLFTQKKITLLPCLPNSFATTCS